MHTSRPDSRPDSQPNSWPAEQSARDLRVCTSHRLPADASAAGLRTTLCEPQLQGLPGTDTGIGRDSLGRAVLASWLTPPAAEGIANARFASTQKS